MATKSIRTTITYTGNNISVRTVYTDKKFSHIEVFRNTTNTISNSSAFIITKDDYRDFISLLNDVASDLTKEGAD